MRYFLSIILVTFFMISFAQNEFHVFPIDGETIKGSPNGNGSIKDPWDLQTALSQSSERVNGGDIIWLHKGVYNGRYKSSLKSTNSKFITVSAFRNDLVVLNGNVKSKAKQVLEVNGKGVKFKNFEVTFLGQYSRNAEDIDFKACGGISHNSGVSIFQNLKIYNNPGLGFGSWKNTGGSIIEDCMIYFNGFTGKVRGSGEGLYVQNNSDEIRIIRNNIIYGNYYKGIEVWSASSGIKGDFVKNIELSNNIVFNNGVPSGRHWGNVIIASNDKEGINIARNIKVKDNVFYHNVDLIKHNKLGNASSLALGFIKHAPVKNVEVTNNVIIGQNNGFSIMYAESLVLKNNLIYTGYVHLEKNTKPFLSPERFEMSNNKYFTKNTRTFRIMKDKDYPFPDWQNSFSTDSDSQWQLIRDFQSDPVLMLSQMETNSNAFNIVLLEKEGKSITVDFSSKNIKKGQMYTIYDMENRDVVAKSGILGKDKKVVFPMGLSAYEKPLHNTIAKKSASNFGVYRIEFEKPRRKIGFLQRFFGWLF